MKKSMCGIMITIVTIIIGILSLTGNHLFAQNKSGAMKVGVYDSRIITFAWSRSDFFSQILEKASQQSDSAEKAHDTARIRELSIARMSYQHLLHQMVFSNGSIGIVMDFVKEKLPALAKAEGVHVLLSKWELNFIDPSIEIIDLTDQVAKLFNPKENIDNMVNEIKKQDPIPLEELSVEADMLDSYCRKFGKK